jgi:hypothetical protein
MDKKERPNPVKIPFSRYFEFTDIAELYLRSIPGKKTRLAYAIERVTGVESIQKAVNNYNKAVADLRSEHAVADDKGVIQTREGRKGEDKYSYTAEAEKQLRADLVALLDAEIEVSPYYSTVVPKELSIYQIERLRGIVIDPEYSIEFDDDGDKNIQ